MTVPATMRALVFDRHGGPEVHRLATIPTPRPRTGEALLRVEACALNHLDVFVREGWPGLKLEMPHVGGSDVAGRVAAVGEGVDGGMIGRRFVLYPSLGCGRCEWCAKGELSMCAEHRLIGEHVPGGLAEYVAVPAANLKPVPDGHRAEDAAAAALVYVTAWRMLRRARLRPGETVLVVGSGGGVNTAAIQIARHMGASRVFVAGGSAAKLEKAKALGATDVMSYRDADFSREVYKATSKRGVDVVVDNVGKDTWEKSLRALARGGRLATVGGTTGYDIQGGLNHIFWKQLEIVGSTMGSRAEFDEVMDLVFAGKLAPVVDRVLPLDRAIDGVRALEAGEAFGKIVVAP